MKILENILLKMSNLGEHQKKFIITLITTLTLNRGKANFRNLSRYSSLSEKTYSRWSRRQFDFIELNRLNMMDTQIEV
jgi:hypothetical protein